jgi:hypothetical protein
VRAVKYNDKVCAFFDSKGQLAYNSMFFNGTETLNDGRTCVNDDSGSSNCNGYNSNSNRGSASTWRTSLKIHYVDNNRPGNPPAAQRGYLDYYGKLNKEMECPKVTIKIPPGDLYNLANVKNSPKLFSPPLYIRAATMIRGGSDAIASAEESYGITDFHYPEIKVQFGANIYKMSLGLGYVGNEDVPETYATSPSTLQATTVYNGKSYMEELYLRKEYDVNSGWPKLCLYRKVKDQNGLYLSPILVGCVKRDRPYVDNYKERNFDVTLPVRKTVVAEPI